MQIFHNAWDEVYIKIGWMNAYKKTMMNLTFGDSGNDLSSNKLMDLFGKEILTFREELFKLQPVFTFKELKKQITSPEQVYREKQIKNLVQPLPD